MNIANGDLRGATDAVITKLKELGIHSMSNGSRNPHPQPSPAHGAGLQLRVRYTADPSANSLRCPGTDQGDLRGLFGPDLDGRG